MVTFLILLDYEKLLFLKPRKVAGTSFEIALSRYAQGDDIITPISQEDEQVRTELGYSGPRNYLDGNGNRKFSNHISAVEVKQKLGREWEVLNKVSIVRNPFDVYVSLFFYHNGPEADISRISNWYLDGPGVSYLGVNHKQYFVKHKLIVNRFIRYEFLEQDIVSMEKEFPSLAGLYCTFREIKSKSGLRSSASYNLPKVFSGHADLKARIESLHCFEFDRFGYSLV